MSSKLILNEELPPKIRRALDSEARADDITVNDTAVRVLSKHFQIEWEPAKARFRRVSPRFKLRVPEELHRRIRIEAAMRGMTIRGVVLDLLSEHYGVDKIDTSRKRRKEKV